MGQEHRSEASRAWVRGLGCRCCSAYVVEQANHATTYTYLSLTTAVVLRAPFRSVCWGPSLAHKTAHLHMRSFKLFQRNSWRARGIGDHRKYVRYSTHRRIFLPEASRPSCSPWFFVSLPATPYTVDGSLPFLSLSLVHLFLWLRQCSVSPRPPCPAGKQQIAIQPRQFVFRSRVIGIDSCVRAGRPALPSSQRG